MSHGVSISETLRQLQTELEVTRSSLGELLSSTSHLADDSSDIDGSLGLVLNELQSVRRSIDQWKQVYQKTSDTNISRSASPLPRLLSGRSISPRQPSPPLRSSSGLSGSPLRAPYLSPRLHTRSSSDYHAPGLASSISDMSFPETNSSSSSSSDSSSGDDFSHDSLPYHPPASLYEDDPEDAHPDYTSSLQCHINQSLGFPSIDRSTSPSSTPPALEPLADQLANKFKSFPKPMPSLRSSLHQPVVKSDSSPINNLPPLFTRSRSNSSAHFSLPSPLSVPVHPPVLQTTPPPPTVPATNNVAPEKSTSLDYNLKSRLTRILKQSHAKQPDTKSLLLIPTSPELPRYRGHHRSRSVDDSSADWVNGSLFEVAFGTQLRANDPDDSSTPAPASTGVLTVSEPPAFPRSLSHPTHHFPTSSASFPSQPPPPAAPNAPVATTMAATELSSLDPSHPPSSRFTAVDPAVSATLPRFTPTGAADSRMFSEAHRPSAPATAGPSNTLQKSPSLVGQPSSASSNRGHPINWNARFQELLDALQKLDPRSEERLPVYLDLSRLAKDFAATAIRYGVIIIDELYLPEAHKTIPPAPQVGGVAGGIKYIYHGILFKFASKMGYDSTSSSLYPTEEAAQKAAGHEMKANTRFFSVVLNQGLNIRLPLFILIDYKGWRLSAQSILPISRNTLMYGSSNGGITTVAAPNFHKLMGQACAELNIASHLGGTEESHAELYGPTDIEGHTSPADNRNYLIDLARVFPPTQSIHVGESTWLYEHFRPEFVRKYPRPLCSDAFSKFLKVDPRKDQFEQDILKASVELLVATKAFASQIDKLAKDDIVSLRSNFKHLIHREGINFRYIGWLRRFCQHPEAKRFILVEMFVRTLRKLLFADLRAKLSSPAPHLLLSQEAAVEVIIEWFNVILEEHIRASVPKSAASVAPSSPMSTPPQAEVPPLSHSSSLPSVKANRPLIHVPINPLAPLTSNVVEERHLHPTPRRRDRLKRRSELHRRGEDESADGLQQQKSRSKSPSRRSIFSHLFLKPKIDANSSSIDRNVSPPPSLPLSTIREPSQFVDPIQLKTASRSLKPTPRSTDRVGSSPPVEATPSTILPTPLLTASSATTAGAAAVPRSVPTIAIPNQHNVAPPSTSTPAADGVRPSPPLLSHIPRLHPASISHGGVSFLSAAPDPLSPRLPPCSPRGTLWQKTPALDVASTYWSQICNLLPQKYSTGGLAASPEEFNEFSTLAQRISFLKSEIQTYGFSMLFKQLCDLSGIRLRSVALKTLENPLLVRKMYFTRADIEELVPRVKVMAVMDVVEAEALWIELANRDPEEADRLFSVVMDRYENAINSTPDQHSLSLRYAEVLVEQARKTNKHHRRIDLYKMAVRVYSDSGLWDRLGDLARDILEWYYRIQGWSATSKNATLATDLHNLVTSCYQSLTRDPNSGYWAAWGDYLINLSPEAAGEKYQKAFETDPTFLHEIRSWAPAFSGSTLASIVQIYHQHECFLWINSSECPYISDQTLEALSVHCQGQVRYVVLKSLLSVTDVGLAALSLLGPSITHLELFDLQSTSPHGWLQLFEFLPNLKTVALTLRPPQRVTPSLEVLFGRALAKLARCSAKLDRAIFSDCPGVSVSLSEFASLKHLSCLEILDCNNVGQALISFCQLSSLSLKTLVLQQSFGPETSSMTVSALLQLLPTSLTSLYLCESCAIQPKDVQVFLKRCPGLEKLTFYKCSAVPIEVFQVVARYAKNLTRLKLGDLVDLTNDSIQRLTQRKSRRNGLKNLQELELICASRYRSSSAALDAAAIEAIKKMCPVLKTLYISSVRLATAQRTIEDQLQQQFPEFTLRISESFY